MANPFSGVSCDFRERVSFMVWLWYNVRGSAPMAFRIWVRKVCIEGETRCGSVVEEGLAGY